MGTIYLRRQDPVHAGNQHGRHTQLRRIRDVSRNGEGCENGKGGEEGAEVTFAAVDPGRRARYNGDGYDSDRIRFKLGRATSAGSGAGIVFGHRAAELGL